MPDREELEKLVAELRARREEAEAEAGHAAARLARMVSGLTPLAETDPAAVRATADTFADAVDRLRLLGEFGRDLRRLLM
jgi:hypothetical protein